MRLLHRVIAYHSYTHVYPNGDRYFAVIQDAQLILFSCFFICIRVLIDLAVLAAEMAFTSEQGFGACRPTFYVFYNPQNVL